MTAGDEPLQYCSIKSFLIIVSTSSRHLRNGNLVNFGSDSSRVCLSRTKHKRLSLTDFDAVLNLLLLVSDVGVQTEVNHRE